MKKLLGLVLMFALFTSCGLQDQIDQINKTTNKNARDIGNIEARVKVLEEQRVSDREQLTLLNDALNLSTTSINNQIASINTQIGVLSTQGTVTQADVAALQASVSGVLTNISLLDGRLSAVEGSTVVLQSDVAALNLSLLQMYQDLNTQLSNVGITITDLQNDNSVVNTALSTVQTNVTSLQSSLNSALVQIAILQGYNNIVSIKDVCGKQGSFDEVFLKLSNGKYLASFSDNVSGLNTRFSVLSDGTFRTTDGTNCNFTVSSNGTVISNEHN